MADFFAGILDNLRSVGDSTSGFFNSAIGQAVAKGVKGGFGEEGQRKEVNPRDGFFGQENGNVSYSPTPDKVQKPESVNYSDIERDWLLRLHRFAGLDATNTKVTLGSK